MVRKLARPGERRLRLLDRVAAVALVIGAVAGIVSEPSGNVGPLSVLFAAVSAGTVAWRRKSPVTSTPVAITALSALSAVQTTNANASIIFEPVAMALDFYFLGRAGAGKYQAKIFASSLGYAFATFVFDAFRSGNTTPVTIVSGWAFFVGLPFAFGYTLTMRGLLVGQLRATAASLEQEQQAIAGYAAGEERARMARELHDVVAHGLSVMVIQTSAARRTLLRDRGAARAAVRVVEQAGRDALEDLRRIMGVVRRDDGPAGPTPGLAQLEALVARARAGGLVVNLHMEGEVVPLPPSLEIVAYRIVQESLTNAIKHAGNAEAVVCVKFEARTLDLEISDTGHGLDFPVHGASGPGYGLLGMRERAALFGGKFSAGPVRDGGFRVHASLPLDGVAC